MKPNAQKSIDPTERAKTAAAVIYAIFADRTDLTYADLEEAEWCIEKIKRSIREVKQGRPSRGESDSEASDPAGSSLRLKE